MKGADIDTKLMTPIINYILHCLPKNIKKKFWCNVRYDEKDSYSKIIKMPIFSFDD